MGGWHVPNVRLENLVFKLLHRLTWKRLSSALLLLVASLQLPTKPSSIFTLQFQRMWVYQNLFRRDFGLTPFQFQVKSMLELDSVNVKSGSDMACSENFVWKSVEHWLCVLNMHVRPWAWEFLQISQNNIIISTEICKSFVCFVSLFVSVAIFVNYLTQIATCK